jgi:hypothetical protein
VQASGVKRAVAEPDDDLLDSAEPSDGPSVEKRQRGDLDTVTLSHHVP